MTTETQPVLFGIVDSHRFLGIGETTLKGLIRSGQLHPVKVGRRTLLYRNELERWAAHLAHDAGVPLDLHESAS